MMTEKDIKVVQNIVDTCKECKFATCEQCEISNTEVKSIEQLLLKVLEQEHIIKGKDCVIETQSHNEEILLNQLKEKYINDKTLDLVLDFLYDTWHEYPHTIAYALCKYAFDADIECVNCENKKCKDCLRKFFKEKAENIKERKLE